MEKYTHTDASPEVDSQCIAILVVPVLPTRGRNSQIHNFGGIFKYDTQRTRNRINIVNKTPLFSESTEIVYFQYTNLWGVPQRSRLCIKGARAGNRSLGGRRAPQCNNDNRLAGHQNAKKVR